MWKTKAYKVKLGIADDIKKAISSAESGAKSVERTSVNALDVALRMITNIQGNAKSGYSELKRLDSIIDNELKTIKKEISELKSAGLNISGLSSTVANIESNKKQLSDWMEKVRKLSN